MAFGGPKAATARARLNGYASGLEVSAAKDLEQRKIAFSMNNCAFLGWMSNRGTIDLTS